METSAHVVGALIVIVLGLVTTVLFASFLTDSYLSAVVLVLAGGPAWALAFCLASTDADFGHDVWRTRDEWLRILPWTFLLAPLVIPNVVLLLTFIRDSRADGGRSYFSWDRMRPGEGHRDHHWPG